ncbi:GTP-sensing pleiotropic transcriptional regulator CodY [Aneurinibacillus sp. Ricciae_BoGa-3]|uniref:GTP-sensing pleiotropic transcriptional regulator CodY n=1 Tax=Aneurinibacillus sp. Ricciae_BoGa-3 TaxID=3022697 RepID=UPI0023423F30|nr:GTP-sensing pleiotropic transcriptional regulator CodY [Aneurinibacillus sp. Ricciae_BoGa-3]WCK53290.1 GTP-sensing pleiotropic transcriptional regulator CodY [Aneurinibacillus sp. Ricciae_BoGa-3]
MTLLQRIRKINRILQLSSGHDIRFSEMADRLGEVLEANIYILSKKGKLLGVSSEANIPNERMEKYIRDRKFPDEYVQKALRIEEPTENIPLSHYLTAFPTEIHDMLKEGWTTIVPILGAGEKLGLVILSRLDRQFTKEDMVLSEFAATVVGSEITKSKVEDLAEQTRKQTIIGLAIDSLSFSEIDAIKAILAHIEGNEGLVIASKIADDVGITRSVIVNALRKLESAGILESRSLGMKGTHIKILNEFVFSKIEKIAQHVY